MTNGNAERSGNDLPFFNRELSWIEFNARVLEQGLRIELPLLERLRFLTIVSSNFDEFFMVRYASLKRIAKTARGPACPSGITVRELITKIHARVAELVQSLYGCLMDDLFPRLSENGLCFLRPGMYTSSQARYLQSLFLKEIFPVLTPVKAAVGERFPLAGNTRLHAAFELIPIGDRPDRYERHTAVLQVPPNLDRLVMIPDDGGGRVCFTLLEDVILSNAGALFPGYAIQSSVLFRVTRDADLGVDEERDEDFLEAMEEIVAGREHSDPVRLEVSADGSPSLRERLVKLFGLEPAEVYTVSGPIDPRVFIGLVELAGYDRLRYPEWKPVVPPEFSPDEPIWDVIRTRDVALFHPYESFDPVLRFINDAARDPQVLAIKMTLYRTSGRSPVVRALAAAAESGKQVTALVELKARFDEERNISWANQLERAGVIVVYGIAKLKVHAKAILVVRRETTGIRRYVHLGTGNYNDRTAKVYTDIGLFSAKEDLTAEVSLFFNAITGYSSAPMLRKLAMSPISLKHRILTMIDREAERAGAGMPGVIMAKLNSLADPDVIGALYRASQAGVQVLLNVRGICMLVPGVPGVSENIHVTSIIDRFLEHSRIVYFHNGGDEEVFLSSADWMTRNLERRVELLFPVEQEDLRERISEALRVSFRDNTNASLLTRDGSYVRIRPQQDEEPIRAQEELYRDAVRRASRTERLRRGEEFAVRRKPPRTR
jgi:polyphosphate kinase